MKISARNQLQGTVKDVHKGATTAHVEIEVGGAVLTASITNEADRGIEAREGQEGLCRDQGVRRDGRHRLMD